MNETGNKYRIDLEEYQAGLQTKSGRLLADCELATKLQTSGFLGEKRNEKNAKDACAHLKHPSQHKSIRTSFKYCTLCTTWLC